MKMCAWTAVLSISQVEPGASIDLFPHEMSLKFEARRRGAMIEAEGRGQAGGVARPETG